MTVKFKDRILLCLLIISIVVANTYMIPLAADLVCPLYLDGDIMYYDADYEQTYFTLRADEAFNWDTVNANRIYIDDTPAQKYEKISENTITVYFGKILLHQYTYTLSFSDEVLSVNNNTFNSLVLNDYKTVIADLNSDTSKLYGKSSNIKVENIYSGSGDYETDVFCLSGRDSTVYSGEYVIYKTQNSIKGFEFYNYTCGWPYLEGGFAVYVSKDNNDYKKLDSSYITQKNLTSDEKRLPNTSAFSYYTCKKVTLHNIEGLNEIRYIKIVFPSVLSSAAKAMLGDVKITTSRSENMAKLKKAENIPASSQIELEFGTAMNALKKDMIKINGGISVSSLVFGNNKTSAVLYLNKKLNANSEYVLTINSSDVASENRYIGFHTEYTSGYENYEWNSVKIGGGGMITGIIYHPTEPDLMYCRTDVGGIFRRDFENNCWIPVMDFFGIEEENYLQINGFCLDANNPDVIYAACGGYWYEKGRVFKSDDRGETWTPLGLAPVFVSNTGRLDGECIAVDPKDSNVVYCGTSYEGLYVSRDAGNTWSRVEGIPYGSVPSTSAEYSENNAYGIRTVYFGENAVYAGVYGYGVYKSHDNGQNWELMQGSPVKPKRMIEYRDKLYVSCYVDAESGFEDGMYAWSESYGWTSDAPIPAKSMNGITKTVLDGNDVLFCARHNGQRLYYKINDGEWNAILDGNENYKKTDVSENMSWATAHNNSGNGIIANYAGALAAKPVCEEKAELWLGDGWSVWCNPDALNPDSKFYAECRNLEETVVNTVVAPVSGDVSLITGIYDYAGFIHGDITKAAQNLPEIQYGKSYVLPTSVTSVDYCPSNTNFLVYFTDTYNSDTVVNSGSLGVVAVSEDNGKTWSSGGWRRKDDFYSGNVAMGADVGDNGYPVIVAIPKSNGTSTAVAKRSVDFGRTWQDVKGLPENLLVGSWQKSRKILCADRMNGSKFYVYDKNNGEFYYSDDDGENFIKTADFKISPQSSNTNRALINSIEANPLKEGDVIFSAYNRGLYRTSDSGRTVFKVDGVENVEAVTFGAPVPSTGISSVFVLAEIDGLRGIYRSDDDCKTWVRLKNDKQGFGMSQMCIEGDKNVFGRVYLGTSGRGVMYSEPSANQEQPQTYEVKEFTDDSASDGWLKLTNVKAMSKDDYTYKGWYGVNGNGNGSVIFAFDNSGAKEVDGVIHRLDGTPEEIKFAIGTFDYRSLTEFNLLVSSDGIVYTGIGTLKDYTNKSDLSLYSDVNLQSWIVKHCISLDKTVLGENTKYVKIDMPPTGAMMIKPYVRYRVPVVDYRLLPIYLNANGKPLSKLKAGEVTVKYMVEGEKKDEGYVMITAVYNDDVLADITMKTSTEIHEGSVTVTKPETARIKTFLFKDLDNLIPACDAIEFE